MRILFGLGDDVTVHRATPGASALSSSPGASTSVDRIAQRVDALRGQTRSHVRDSQLCCGRSRSVLDADLDEAGRTGELT